MCIQIIDEVQAVVGTTCILIPHYYPDKNVSGVLLHTEMNKEKPI